MIILVPISKGMLKNELTEWEIGALNYYLSISDKTARIDELAACRRSLNMILKNICINEYGIDADSDDIRGFKSILSKKNFFYIEKNAKWIPKSKHHDSMKTQMKVIDSHRNPNEYHYKEPSQRAVDQAKIAIEIFLENYFKGHKKYTVEIIHGVLSKEKKERVKDLFLPSSLEPLISRGNPNEKQVVQKKTSTLTRSNYSGTPRPKERLQSKYGLSEPIRIQKEREARNKQRFRNYRNLLIGVFCLSMLIYISQFISGKLAIESNTPVVEKNDNIRPINRNVYVSTKQANVRSGPSKDYSIIGKVNQGVRIFIDAQDVRTGWYKLRHTQGIGYISNKVVSYDNVNISDSKHKSSSNANDITRSEKSSTSIDALYEQQNKERAILDEKRKARNLKRAALSKKQSEERWKKNQEEFKRAYNQVGKDVDRGIESVDANYQRGLNGQTQK